MLIRKAFLSSTLIVTLAATAQAATGEARPAQSAVWQLEVVEPAWQQMSPMAQFEAHIERIAATVTKMDRDALAQAANDAYRSLIASIESADDRPAK